MDWLHDPQWSPYIAGCGIGLLTGLTFLLSNKPLACSTSFAKTSGLIEKLFRGKSATNRPYFQKFSPDIDWQWMLVAGIFVGGFLSAWLSGSLEVSFVQQWWGQVIGDSVIVRLIGGFFGGVLVGFGARWAGGCTSGHGISGMIQLALGSIVAVMVFFMGGIATAFLLVHLFT